MTSMSLPLGFRFNPTHVELIKYYLKRKSMGKHILFEPIAEIDIYQYSPWDLPDKSFLKSKDLEWFFYCPVSEKYPSGARLNRATETGFWKASGKDRAVTYKEETIGLIKTLVFHKGRPPKGDRTNWVMHEYRILEKELADAQVNQASYVLVKVFEKSGPGPRNGAQYGAPFNEEEWDTAEDDEVVICTETLQTSKSLPLSAVANNHTDSDVPSTFFHGSTSAASLQPLDSSLLSAVTRNYYSVTPTKSACLSLTNVAQNCGNSVDTGTFFQGSMSTVSVLPSESRLLSAVAHNNNSVISGAFFQSGTPTGPLPVSGPSTAMFLANHVTPPTEEEVDVESLLAMLPKDDVGQVNGEEYIELDDIYADLDAIADWEELSRMLK